MYQQILPGQTKTINNTRSNTDNSIPCNFLRHYLPIHYDLVSIQVQVYARASAEIAIDRSIWNTIHSISYGFTE